MSEQTIHHDHMPLWEGVLSRAFIIAVCDMDRRCLRLMDVSDFPDGARVQLHRYPQELAGRDFRYLANYTLERLNSDWRINDIVQGNDCVWVHLHVYGLADMAYGDREPEWRYLHQSYKVWDRVIDRYDELYQEVRRG